MSDRHTPASLADVLERDYFPMPPGGRSLSLSEYEWRMVVTALRSSEAVERDAARYRWLRVNQSSHYIWDMPTSSQGDQLLQDVELDAAIDAAMRQSAGEGKE